MKKYTLFLLSLFIVFPAVVHAQTNTPRKLREQVVENRCEKVTTHISNLKSRLTTDETIRLNRHQKVIDRLNSIISKLETNNINVDSLKTRVTTLTEKKNTWYQSYTLLLSKLDQTAQLSCGDSDGAYKQAITDVKAQRMTMHNANMDFWTYVQSTIRPEIQTVRNQLKSTKTQ